MKIVYQINKITLIINLLLFLIPWFGMLFMMPLGFIQVVSSIWLLTQKKRTSRNIQRMVTIHLILSFIVITVMYYINNQWDWVFITGMIISGLLAFFFMFVSYTNHMEYERKLSLTTNH